MGVAMFAARKIALLNSISNLECMRMQISAQQQALSDQACNLTMQQGNLQMCALPMQNGGGGYSGYGGMGQNLAMIGGVFGSLFGGQAYGQAGSQLGMAGGSIYDMFSGGGGYSGGGNNYQFQAMQQENMMIQQQIMAIQQQEKRLEATAKQLETQLGLKNKEYEGIEKAEEKAIQRSAPKFE